MGFVKDHPRGSRQNPGVGRTLSLQLDGEVGEEQMMIDDNNIALHAAAPHFSDEAPLPLAALLASASIGARIQFVPKRTGLGKFSKFRAVASRGRFLPGGNRTILLDLLQSAEDGLIREVIEFLATQIIVAAFHVADGEPGAGS